MSNGKERDPINYIKGIYDAILREEVTNLFKHLYVCSNLAEASLTLGYKFLTMKVS